MTQSSVSAEMTSFLTPWGHPGHDPGWDRHWCSVFWSVDSEQELVLWLLLTSQAI